MSTRRVDVATRASSGVSATVFAGRGNLYIERRGCGTPLICIAGAGGDAAIFQHLADSLSDRHTVFSYDRRGNSRSIFGLSRHTLDDHVADVVRLMDAFDVERAHFLAHSLGGAIALRFALKNPGRLAGVILHEPFWFPTFVRDPAALGAFIEHESRIIRERLCHPCGDFEARIRLFGGESFVASIGAIAARRMFANAEISHVEREEFARWAPSVEELHSLKRAPIELLVGKATHFFFADVVRAFENALDRKAIMVPGSHGGISDHADAVAEHVHLALTRFKDNAAIFSHRRK
jgi:pimeloyl-ACP methyl ester carboxylesterase